MTLPRVQLADDTQRMARAVGPRGITGESLVRHVGVVLEWAQGFHDIDVSPLLAAGECCRKLCTPGCGFHQCGEVDVVGHPTLLEVGGLAGNELFSDGECGL